MWGGGQLGQGSFKSLYEPFRCLDCVFETIRESRDQRWVKFDFDPDIDKNACYHMKHINYPLGGPQPKQNLVLNLLKRHIDVISLCAEDATEVNKLREQTGFFQSFFSLSLSAWTKV